MIHYNTYCLRILKKSVTTIPQIYLNKGLNINGYNDYIFNYSAYLNLDFKLSPLFVHYFNYSARRGNVAPPSIIF